VRRHRRGSSRRLQTRLFLWFLVAIGVAFGTVHLTVWLEQQGNDQPPPSMHVMASTIAKHAAATWDDAAALDRYVAQVRDDVGLELRVLRDPSAVPARRAHGPLLPDPRGGLLIPVKRGDVVLGAIELGSRKPWRPPLWLGVGVGLVVLGIGARAVSRRLAWPLEDVAAAAERFGAGDLEARTHVAGGRHFVADEVREVATAFDQMAERIARVVRDQRELLAAISHELRSPLGRARVALEIARDRGGDPAAIDDVERQLGDVDAILGDLLAAARAGLSDVKRASTPIASWLRARIETEPASPAIVLAASDDDPVVAIDTALMNRALHNVLANARDHGHPAGAPIEVRLEADAARVTIVVRDRGPGFAPELLSRAFDPFVKGDAARTPGSGYGLGLALVGRIAEAHGGRAFARNAADSGGGAEVGVELPRAIV
jgi:signal transduction histidine kinase